MTPHLFYKVCYCCCIFLCEVHIEQILQKSTVMLFMVSDFVLCTAFPSCFIYFALFLPEMLGLSYLQKYLIKFLSFYILQYHIPIAQPDQQSNFQGAVMYFLLIFIS